MSAFVRLRFDDGQGRHFPSWSDPPTFRGIVLDSRVSLQISLTDVDAVNDDPIGVVNVTGEQLEYVRSVGAGKVVQIPVRDQNPQIVFLGVAVFDD